MGRGEFRVEFDGLAIAGDGLVQLPLDIQGNAEVVVGAGVFRVEFDGLTEAGDGLVELALILQGIAEVVVGDGVFRVEFDGLAIAGDGRVQLALVLQGRRRGCCRRWRIFGSSSMAFWYSAMASSTSPLVFRATPRLLWAMANFGSSSMAWR